MKVALFILATTLLSSLCSAQSVYAANYLLGQWTFSVSDYQYDEANTCLPVGTVEIIPNPSNSSSVYFKASQWRGPACSTANVTNSTRGYKYELGIAANSTEEQDLSVATSNSQGAYNGLTVESWNEFQYLFTFSGPRYGGGPVSQGYLTKITANYSDSSDSESSDDDYYCNITINYATYDLCAFGNNNSTKIFYTADPLDGNLSFSIGQSGVNSCNNNGSVWGTYQDDVYNCYDVATQAPTYTLLNEYYDDEGIVITYPIVPASNMSGSRNFQLIVNLACDLNSISIKHTTFAMSLLVNNTANLETMTINGSSIYGCPTTMYQTNNNTNQDDSDSSDDEEICEAISVDSDYIFNICAFNETGLFKISDILGGSLSFGISTSPAAFCFSGDNVWGVYHDNQDNCYEVATQNPTFSLYNEEDPNQGLTATFPISTSQALNVRSFQLVMNLLCDIDAMEPSETSFQMDLFATDMGDIETITVTGSSIYGCRVEANDYSDSDEAFDN